MADENNSNEDGQFVPDGSMEPLSPQEADNTDYGLMVGERIQKKDLQQEMRDSYLAYAMSVIVDRALPDVRDGMKPVHRRVIYAMYDGGYRPDRGYSKCARVVGEVMGKYHPHGDSAIYDTLVRMAQSWSMRYTLVDGQGNFGSPGDDPAAAMRYTECRMAPLAMEMVRDIDKDTVDFLPNYDGKTQEPTVLPARFPNLLCNGSSGIAVGMATNIPPHNMREVAEGVHWALDHPDASREELLENLIRIIKGPDFPTGATILGHKGIEQAYRTGRGLITMRAVVNTEEIKGRMCLVITELPYQVNPDRLVVSIREAVSFRKTVARLHAEFTGKKDWFFNIWQPDFVVDRESGQKVPFFEADEEQLATDPDCWTLKPNEDWHGFGEVEEGYCMLDPIKVSLVTPGVLTDGSLAESGIPAAVVSAYLDNKGIVVEKTTDFTILVLFSLGVTNGKWGTLLNALFEFKQDYDNNEPLRRVLPKLVKDNPHEYGETGLKELCDKMFAAMKELGTTKALSAAFSVLPKPDMTPVEAYENLVHNNVESMAVDQIADRTVATGVVPYPPGIPLLMPGENAGPADGPVLGYLKSLQAFDRKFPGFGHDTHGVEVKDGTYYVLCLKNK